MAPPGVISEGLPGSKIGSELVKINNSVMVEAFPYKGGEFTGSLLGGKPFDGEVKNVNILYKRFDGVVKEGALAYPDRTRLQRPEASTPFQKMLRQEDTPFQRLEKNAVFSNEDDGLRRAILNIDPRYTKLSVDEKFDVNNDNQRRLFDTLFSKELLTGMAGNSEKMAAVRKLSDGIVSFYKSCILVDKIANWEAACNGTYTGDDQRLQQLVTQNDRAREAVDSLDLDADGKKLLVDLYQRRYLNYMIDETDVYKEEHPEGIIKSKSNPLYFKRGRLDGDFYHADSMNVGILRSMDKSPVDLRFSTVPEKQPGISPELYTRCPDRLNMADPGGKVDRDPDSWLSYNFLSGNSPFVNGLSGSMLIEIRAMLYLKARLDAEDVEGNFLASSAMVDVLDDYFSAISGLYVYVDGGHSLFEIQSSFKQTWVKGAFISTFEGQEWGEVGQMLYKDLESFKKAYQATKLFDRVLQNQRSVHSQLVYGDPAIQSARVAKTADLALSQTMESRRVLYKPGDVLISELGSAASVLYKVVDNLSGESQKELCAHLLGEGRLLDGGGVAEVLAAVKRVSATSSSDTEVASAVDRAAVMSLMGDIGGFYTTPANVSEQLMLELNDGFVRLDLEVPTSQEIEHVKKISGSASVGPDKRIERKVRQFESISEIPLWAGIHNKGVEADELLGVSTEHRIPESRWTKFDIKRTRLQEAEEPFVGHMSASPGEILLVWDLLRGEKGKDQFSKFFPLSSTLSTDDMRRKFMDDLTANEQSQRYARAAGAGALLVGLGYHSAVEVLEGILVYTGQNIRQEGVLLSSQRDAGHLFGSGAATDLMVELFSSNSKL
ncbi:hypothetical protein [Pseudomonas sp. T1.Ur]|uniref:hypothetical protein n=1 Tax=Pseudomonas sp. T1.Ur TaxID=2928704 RepID=UPI00201DDD54|nr:hypothetical protein [Pseudomonas sp. T1.Ur]MCL6702963.1 hypothetical protein [Pseudomonas sp. T1.Ur]